MIVGILGAGQLGRMIAMAGYPLGLRFRTLDLSSEAPSGPVSELVVADFNDTDALKRFARGLSLVMPPPEALEVAQDRVSEKSFFERLGIPAPRFVAVNYWDDLKTALNEIGLPAVLKTRRFGYDGKGQFVLRKTEDVSLAWQSLSGVPLILESFVAFEREVSILAARSRLGETLFYPLVEN